MRNLPFYPLMVILLIGLGGYLGCDPNSIRPALEEVVGGGASQPSASGVPATYTTIPQRSANTILIGSFNLERLGKSKMAKPWVMERMAAIIRQFDVIALQEITDKEQRALPALLNYVNQGGANYTYTVSPRIGREATGYYEQYAYVYDATRIQSGPEFSYVVQDQSDVMHREPFVGRFQTLAATPFNFTLVNVHTDPDEIKYELDVLADVYQNVRQFEYPEDDVILLGDLNAAPGKLQKLEQIPSIAPLVANVSTMTKGSKTNDNILIDQQTTREFTGRAGILDMAQAFNATADEADEISDHLPIWAEFSIQEQVPRTALLQNTSQR